MTLPVVLLNGVMMTMDSWVFQRRALEPQYRCVLHDFRGQLRNPMPGPFHMSQHVDDLVALLDREQIERVHVVGTSYGGEVGMMFALAHPERVESLVVIACVSHVEPPLRTAVEVWRDTARSSPETLYDISAPYNFSAGLLTPTFMEAGRMRLRSYPRSFFDSFADLCDAFLELDITDRLHEITARTLVIAAANDILKPLHYSEILASRMKNARLQVIPEAAHAVFLEKANDVNALLLEHLSR